MTKAYKSVSSIQHFLGSILALFPSIYLTVDIDDGGKLAGNIISPIIENSLPYCTAIEDGRILFQKRAQGAFGEVGPIQIQQGTNYNEVVMNVVSLDPKGSYAAFFMDTIVKKSKPQNLYITSATQSGRIVITMNDFLHEAFVSSLVSHLYDTGVCPGVPKFFANYVCKFKEPHTDERVIKKPIQQSLNQAHLVMEKLGFGLFDLIDNKEYEEAFLATKSTDYMIWITMIAHTLFVLRQNFGIVHYDLHLHNIMFSFNNKVKAVPNLPQDRFTRQFYQGRDLSEIHYYYLEIPQLGSGMRNQRILVENNGLLPKVIDFGLTTAEFSIGADKNFVLPIAKEIIEQTYWGREAVIRSSAHDTVGIDYLIYNLAAKFTRIWNGFEGTTKDEKTGVDIEKVSRSDNVRVHAKTLLEELTPFFKAINKQYTFDKVSQRILNKNGIKVQETSLSVKNFADNGDLIHLRDVGEEVVDTGVILKRIFNYLSTINQGYSTNAVYLTRSGLKQVVTQDTPIMDVPYKVNTQRAKEFGWKTDILPMQKFMNQLRKYNTMCLETNSTVFGQKAMKLNIPWDGSVHGRDNICRGIQLEMALWNPKTVVDKPIVGNDLSNKSLIFDPTTGGLKNGITAQLLASSGLQTFRLNKELAGFYLEIYPEATGTDQLINFRYNQHQHIRIGTAGEHSDGTLMKKVNVHLTYYLNRSLEILLGSRQNPYRAAVKAFANTPGFLVTGGLYISRENHQQLTPNITEKDYYQPFGFFYSQNDPKYTGTALQIPESYKKDWAAILVVGHQIKFMQYNDFEDLHKTVRKDVRYLLDDNKVFMSSQKIIGVQQGIPVLKNGKRPFYQACFACGPILIWENQIVFNDTKMINEKLRVDLKREYPIPGLDDVILRDGQEQVAEEFQEYRLYFDAMNSKKYMSEAGESPDPYHMKGANTPQTRTAICQTNDGYIVFISVEGDNFSAPGLDMAQFARMLKKFNIRYAISFDGGFAANQVIRKAGKRPEWLMNNVTGESGTVLIIRTPVIPETVK